MLNIRALLSSRTVFRGVLMASALASYLGVAHDASAFRLGSFSRTCHAQNWMNGRMEQVDEINVYNQPFAPMMAFTRQMPNGRWRIEYNVARIQQFQLPDDVVIFLFFHECAHAQLASDDEGAADCEGLRAMRQANRLSRRTYRQITQVYNSLGRPFPSGQCR